MSLATGDTPTLVGCLRNAGAVARAATGLGSRIAVIPAGARWPDDSLRPALEDWLGAGAVIEGLVGSLSPEAVAARDGFRGARDDLLERVLGCESGKELVERGYEEDVCLARELDVSQSTPLLEDDVYRDAAPGTTCA